jgi:hypothetical protein
VLQGSIGDAAHHIAEQLSALAGSHDGASDLFLYLNKLGITGSGLLEVGLSSLSYVDSMCK